MIQQYEMVKDFHLKFGHPVCETPCQMVPERAKKRYNWMLEEINEFIESDNLYEQADAMIDLIYFALGTLVEMGLEPEPLFEIVHKANMSKLWPDGKPHHNSEGKTIKPANWVDPYSQMKKVIDECSKQIADRI